jgi:CubicO group peptidase (beta-lactamase class C family)
MHHHSNILTRPYSRRRLLAVGGGAAATILGQTRTIAKQTPEPALTAGNPPDQVPMPSTLAADASPEFRAVADALVDAMGRYRVPGAAIGILAGDREEHATFGVASLSSLAPVTADTVFQIGSLTKTYTATAIWSLIDEGALALDAPVRTYIPDLRMADEATAAEVTVGDLLDHTVGCFGDDVFDTGVDDDAIARYVSNRLPEMPQLFPLGAYFSYNNVAFILLGRLIEVVTGTAYNTAMGNLVFGPLGLADSHLDYAAVRQRPYTDGHVAMPINGRDVVAVQTPLWTPRSLGPAGAIWSTTRDLLRYARFHLAAETSQASAGAAVTNAAVVSPESLLRMREPVMDIPGLPLRIGRSWFLQDVDGVRVFTHNGATLGQGAELVVIPEHGFAFAIVANSSAAGPTASDVIQAALASYPGLESLAGKVGILRAFIAPVDVPTVELPPEKLAEYAGSYVAPGISYSVALRDGALEFADEPVGETDTLQSAIQPMSTGPAPVTFLAEDEAILGGARLPFVRDSAGRVAWLSIGARLIPRSD